MMSEEERGQLDEEKTSEETTPTTEIVETVVTTTKARVWLKDEVAGRRRRYIIIGTALIALGVLAVLLLQRTRKKTEETTAETEAANVVVSVRVGRAERRTIAAEVSSLGTITPREQATVSPKISAQISEMRLLKNAVVRAGDVLAVLEARDLRAQRAEAQAALNEARLTLRGLTSGSIPQQDAQAERDLRDARANVENARALYDRRRALYAQGGIALKEVEAARLALTTAEDNLKLAERTFTLRKSAINPNDRSLAETRVVQAQDRVAALDAQLSYAVIRAPITGVVTEQFQYQGEFASPGTRLVTISDISEVIVKAQFADTVVAHLKVEDPVTVLPTDLPGARMSGKVTLISRSADPLNRNVEVWADLGNGAGRLRAGSAAQVVVAAERTEDAVVVPAAAVTLEASNADEGTVMVVDAANVAHETKVTVGIRTPEVVQIVSGLQGGEAVVVEGNYALPDGAKVEINEDAEGEEKDEKKDEKKDEGSAPDEGGGSGP
ncbi:MAG TPA: efflux RND transporter periplasmic adaptor subunit [Pyrinomonadaceae bacterium]|jgi:HlyD family secretion protein